MGSGIEELPRLHLGLDDLQHGLGRPRYLPPVGTEHLVKVGVGVGVGVSVRVRVRVRVKVRVGVRVGIGVGVRVGNSRTPGSSRRLGGPYPYDHP